MWTFLVFNFKHRDQTGSCKHVQLKKSKVKSLLKMFNSFRLVRFQSRYCVFASLRHSRYCVNFSFLHLLTYHDWAPLDVCTWPFDNPLQHFLSIKRIFKRRGLFFWENMQRTFFEALYHSWLKVHWDEIVGLKELFFYFYFAFLKRKLCLQLLNKKW